MTKKNRGKKYVSGDKKKTRKANPEQESRMETRKSKKPKTPKRNYLSAEKTLTMMNNKISINNNNN